MFKKAFILIMVFTFGYISITLAGPPPFQVWKCLVYDGMVVQEMDPVTGLLMVSEDTGVFVTNPNPVPVRVWMRVFNKYGQEIWSGFLYDGNDELMLIPPMAFGWMPLGKALEMGGYKTSGREKFSYQLSMSRPNVVPPNPRLNCVVEVKQVIYESLTFPLNMISTAISVAGPPKIKSFCEAAPERWLRCPDIPGIAK